MNITGHTSLYGIIASPIKHSFSPTMHNRAFEVLGLDSVYLAFDVKEEQFEEAFLGLKALGIKGMNVSMPYKQKIIPYLDELDISAKLCNAVNTVVLRDGKYIGYSSDGYGLMESLRDKNIDVVNKKIVVAGSGGAALAIIMQASLDGAKEIVVYKRRVEDEIFLAQMNLYMQHSTTTIVVKDIQDKESLKADLQDSVAFIHATSVGMAPNMDSSIIEDASYFHPGLCVVDIIYNPLETKLLQLAKEAGCTVMNGKGMLLFQGARAFELFTGYKMPIEEIKKIMEM